MNLSSVVSKDVKGNVPDTNPDGLYFYRVVHYPPVCEIITDNEEFTITFVTLFKMYNYSFRCKYTLLILEK